MRTFFALLALLAALTSVAAPATASPSGVQQARVAIQQAYDRAAAAAARRDADGWLASKSDDFVSVGLDGREVSLASRRMLLTLMLSAVRTVKADTRVTALALTAPTRARVRIREHVVMTLLRPDTKKVSTLVTDTEAESTWALTAAGWRETRCRSVRERGTLDGRPLPSPSS